MGNISKKLMMFAMMFLLFAALIETAEARGGRSSAGRSSSRSVSRSGRTSSNAPASKTIGIGAGVFLLVVCCCIIYYFYSKKKAAETENVELKLTEEGTVEGGLQFSSHFTSVELDGNSIKFNADSQNETRSLQTNAATKGYYEITVNSISEGSVVSLGWGTPGYPVSRMPGWEEHSVGFCSDTGNKLFDSPGVGTPYGKPFGNGDVIGCGYIKAETGSKMEFFYAINGVSCGIAYDTRVFYRDDINEAYPIVSSDGICQLSYNFGIDSKTPFQYSPEGMTHDSAPPAYAQPVNPQYAAPNPQYAAPNPQYAAPNQQQNSSAYPAPAPGESAYPAPVPGGTTLGV